MMTRDNRTKTMSSSSFSKTYTSMISQLPIIAYVPLGTGNAVGSVIGCSYMESSLSKATITKRMSIVNVLRRMIPFGRHHRRRTESSSRSLQRLRSTLQHIQDTILQSTTSSISTIPITELPMIEISNTNFTDLCFFAGGTCNPF